MTGRTIALEALRGLRFGHGDEAALSETIIGILCAIVVIGLAEVAARLLERSAR